MRWLASSSGTLHAKGYAGYWRPQRSSDDEITWPAIKTKGKTTIKAAYERIESRLFGESPYAVGGHLTAVDLFLHTVFRWCRIVGSDVETTTQQFSWLAEVAK